jgi:glutamate dehydrogenase/leucine dehydrogenase
MFDIEYDELGPAKVLELHSSKVDVTAIVVVDNTALGPSIGGVRVSPKVNKQELLRLARTMTLKNSIAGLPHGGGKAGIIADPADPKKELYFRTFARQIRDHRDYIPGPDMGSNEESMAWIFDEIERAVGLPEELGGVPLDKLGATGYGLSICAEAAAPHAGLRLKGARVAIQGFGSVGRAAARFLSERGAIIAAVSDTGGTVYNPAGIDYKELVRLKDARKSVVAYKGGSSRKADEIFSLDVEILIPAATPDVINKDNVETIRAALVLQGANIPATLEAEETMHRKGILSVPDFIANAGGVIMAAMEYSRKTEHDAFGAISARIKANTGLILEKAEREKILPRQAAVEIARGRVLQAMKYRGY